MSKAKAKSKEITCQCRICQHYFNHSCLIYYCERCESLIHNIDIALKDLRFEQVVVHGLFNKFVNKYDLGYSLYQMVAQYVKDDIDIKTSSNDY